MRIRVPRAPVAPVRVASTRVPSTSVPRCSVLSFSVFSLSVPSGRVLRPSVLRPSVLRPSFLRPSVPRPSVRSGPWCSPRVVLRLSTVHDPVIASKAELLRSPSDHGFGPGRPMGLRTVRAVAPSMVCRVDGRGVEKRFVASAWRQSPKRIIGTALADLRRAAAANKCVRLAQRLAALTGPM